VLLWEKYSIRRGSKIGIACLELDAYHISVIFACAELGCQLLLLDRPVTEHTIHKTKAALFGPLDLGIVDLQLAQDPIHQSMMETYCLQLANISDFDTYNIANHDVFSLVADTFFCREDDVFLLASTSGTTSDSTPVLYNHRYTAQLSIRNSKLFNFASTSKIIHIRNMHHASSSLLHFLPALYASEDHWHKYVNFNDFKQVDDFVEMLIINNINMCLLCNHYDLDSLLVRLKVNQITFSHNIDFNISGFTLSKHLFDKAYGHNMNIVSTFGSVDTGVPVFINRLDKNSDRELLGSGLIGYFPNDGFYKLEMHDNLVQLSCPGFWKEPRYLSDRFTKKDNLYYHLHRDNLISISGCSFDLHLLTDYIKLVIKCNDLSVIVDQHNHCLFLVIWDSNINITLADLHAYISNSEFSQCSSSFKKIKHLHKKDFTIDTKVSIDQLRGYLQSAD
jgi:hypothetical protein